MFYSIEKSEFIFNGLNVFKKIYCKFLINIDTTRICKYIYTYLYIHSVIDVFFNNKLRVKLLFTINNLPVKNYK